MNYSNLFKIAIRAIAANKLRSFLTALGIIIGVASVITMLAIGQGKKKHSSQHCGDGFQYDYDKSRSRPQRSRWCASGCVFNGNIENDRLYIHQRRMQFHKRHKSDCKQQRTMDLRKQQHSFKHIRSKPGLSRHTPIVG